MLWTYGTNGIFIVQSTGTKLFVLNCVSFGFLVFLDSKKHDYTLRVFNLKSTSGSFEATEVLNPARSEHITPYPILQSQLYSADQPGKLELLRLGMKSFSFSPSAFFQQQLPLFPCTWCNSGLKGGASVLSLLVCLLACLFVFKTVRALKMQVHPGKWVLASCQKSGSSFYNELLKQNLRRLFKVKLSFTIAVSFFRGRDKKKFVMFAVLFPKFSSVLRWKCFS